MVCAAIFIFTLQALCLSVFGFGFELLETFALIFDPRRLIALGSPGCVFWKVGAGITYVGSFRSTKCRYRSPSQH